MRMKRFVPMVAVSLLMFSNLILIGANNTFAASDNVHEKRLAYVAATAEERHREHLAMNAPITMPYLAGLNYTLAATGSGTSTLDSASKEIVELSLDLCVWKSTRTVVSMDILGGTIRIGDEERSIHSGFAYYVIPSHQLRIAGYIVESGANTPDSVQVLKLAAIVKDDSELSDTNSINPISIEILSPQSRMASEWMLEMSGQVFPQNAQQVSQNEVTLSAILNDNGDTDRFDLLFNSALEKLRERHPDLNINLDLKQYPYPDARTQLIISGEGRTPIDIVSLDQIWLGELADRGLLADLTDYADRWGRASDWYQSNWDGGSYKGKTYGIWVWTDVRGMYYWKDMLDEAGVNSESLETWDGYISAAKKLNETLRPKGIEGVHLTGVGHSPDLWYPYLWMLGGEIVEQKSGHPTKGAYWFPAYNSTEGVEALSFIKDQLDAGIMPQKEHYWGQEFADRKFAVFTEASHVPGYFSGDKKQDLENVGYIPMFPVPTKDVQTATLMGGWELSIPETSQNKDLAWELIQLVVEPDVLAPWLGKYNYLPTQLPIGQSPYSDQLRETNPFFEEMSSLVQYGRGRPSIPEYPQIADNIREAIEAVYDGSKEPKQALDDAAAKSAEALGWTE